MKGPSDGSEEYGEPTYPPCCLEVYEHVKGGEVIFRKHLEATVPSGDATDWRKKSIFSEPYLKMHLLLRNVDVMHIEKYICDML